MSSLILKSIKKTWLKFVRVWNNMVILCILILIWFFILTPTGIFRRFFRKMVYNKEKRRTSFLKKSSPLRPDHYKNPF